jgi:hypothetical protein
MQFAIENNISDNYLNWCLKVQNLNDNDTRGLRYKTFYGRS